MTTIKIKSTDVASQGEFVIISLSDFDGAKHEPFDDEARVAEQALANEAEAQRLADLAAASAAAAASTPAIPADIAALSKDELHAALTAKGISFPAAANKAELQALLIG